MAGPSKPGQVDGETAEVNARTWVWHEGTTAWRPLEPRPFEQISSLDEPSATYYWEPLLTEWLSTTIVIHAGEGGGDPVIYRVIGDEADG